MDTQTMFLETTSKQNQFKKPDKNLSNVQQHHKNSIQNVDHTSQHRQRNVQEHFNLEQKPKSPSNSTTKKQRA